MSSLRQLLAIATFLVTPVVAVAEVADKVPSEGQLWTQGIVLSLLTIVLGAWRIWLVVIPPIAALALFGFFWFDTRDPAFRAALEGELGMRYLASAYAAAALPAAIAYAVFHFRNLARRGADAA
jgi:hypothetical protein